MVVSILIGIIIIGRLIVFCSRSPYYGIFGVLIQALSFSSLLCVFGRPLFGLLVILIYIGGMLIIFLFSTVLRAERYPESGWSDFFIFTVVSWVLCLPLLETWGRGQENSFSGLVLLKEGGLGEVFGYFGLLTCVVVFVLLIALMVVLAFGYEHSQESLRKL